MPRIKVTRNTGTTDSGTGKKKSLQVTLANKKGATTLTRSVSKDAGKKTTERSVVRNLRQGTSVKKTKEDGVKTKTYRADVDRSGGKTYNGTDKQMFKGANKLNKVVEKRGRAADLQTSKKTEMIRKTYGKMAQQGEDITSPSTPGGRALQNDLKSLKEKKAIKEGSQEAGQQVARGLMNAGKVVQRVKQGSKPLMEKAVKEGPVRPIGETVKRVKMDSKPIMEKRIKMSSTPIKK